MKKIILDIRGYDDIEAIHRYIEELFEFPSYYGRNLDALYDMLTDISKHTCVLLIVENNFQIREYVEKLIDTFEDAEIENTKLGVFICDAE